MSSESDNLPIWDGQKLGHYEVWYLTFNNPATQTGFWIRYTLDSPVAGQGEPYARLWFARFDARDSARTFGINRKVPMSAMRAAESVPFSVSIGDAELRHDSARGELSGDGHRVRWDLRWQPCQRTHRQLPGVMYRRGGIGESTVLSPNLDIALSGSIEVDGETYELVDAPGGQSHLWGNRHAHSRAWGHCNAFESHPGATLETLTARMKLRGFVVPPLTVLCLYLDGEAHRFTEYRNVPFTHGEYDATSYRFGARNARICLEGEFRCRTQDLVVAEYTDPSGEPSWCFNTEIADLELTVFERSSRFGRWRERTRLLAPRSGHFETIAREPGNPAAKDHVTVE